MPPYAWLLIYLVLAAIVVFLAIKLSNYVDLLDKKTKLSGALLGGILLAAVTSLPELFTSLTGTIALGNNQMVLGNIMGSDFFDIVIFAIVYFLFFKKITEGKVGEQHYYTIFFTALMVVAVTLAAFVFDKQGWLIGYFNPMSFVIIGIYIISVWKTPKTEEKEEKEEANTKLSVKQIWILFGICSIILIGASIGVTYVTQNVVNGFELGQTFGGSLFLGVATSLPEVTATIALCKKKNFNAAYGDIFGSCVFNIIILAIADAFSFRTIQNGVINYDMTLYKVNNDSFMLIFGTVVTLMLALGSIIFIRSPKFKNNTTSRIVLYVFATLLISAYIVYLILANVGVTFIK